LQLLATLDISTDPVFFGALTALLRRSADIMRQLSA